MYAQYCHKLRTFYLEIIHDPVDDETEDTPLILAIKNFTSFLSPLDLTSDSPVNLQVVKLLLDFGKLKIMYLQFVVKLNCDQIYQRVLSAHSFETHFSSSFDNYINRSTIHVCNGAKS